MGGSPRHSQKRVEVVIIHAGNANGPAAVMYRLDYHIQRHALRFGRQPHRLAPRSAHEGPRAVTPLVVHARRWWVVDVARDVLAVVPRAERSVIVGGGPAATSRTCNP